MADRRIVYFRHGEVVVLLTKDSPPGTQGTPDLTQLRTFLSRTVGVDLSRTPFSIAADGPTRVQSFERLALETGQPQVFSQVVVRLKAWPSDNIITHVGPEPPGHDEQLLSDSIHGVVVAVRDINRWLEQNQDDPKIFIDSAPAPAATRYRITSAEPHWLGLGFNG